ncbi:MAG TPA: hypothetical protein GXX73_14205 [Clostridium sp.]|nr:hypothetical protein [Clostridium sp.]
MLNELLKGILEYFFTNFLTELITVFSEFLVDIMSLSLKVLELPFVRNGVAYAQALAFALLAAKVIYEGINQYILYQSGDPDADPSGLIIRTGKAIAVISTLPWIVLQIFTFGTKVGTDVAKLDFGKMAVSDFKFISSFTASTGGLPMTLIGIIIVIMVLVVAIQATIRGAELALMAVLGPIMALNLTANNQNVWSSWIKQVIIICTSQALQIFMIKGAFTLIATGVSTGGLLVLFGWLWVTIKCPKYLQQFAYSTGFSGTVGGTAKQAGSMAVMRMIMTKGG